MSFSKLQFKKCSIGEKSNLRIKEQVLIQTDQL